MKQSTQAWQMSVSSNWGEQGTMKQSTHTPIGLANECDYSSQGEQQTMNQRTHTPMVAGVSKG